MRSYTYSEGKWSGCKDTLPPTAPSTESDYRASDEKKLAWTTYRDALKQLGFPTSGSTYTCRFGGLTVYARGHATLAQQRKQTETYDFLCVLRISGTPIRVWIDALPNLFLFFTDLDARPVDETLKDFLTDETFTSVLSRVSLLADQIYEGLTHITVEVKQPPQKR